MQQLSERRSRAHVHDRVIGARTDYNYFWRAPRAHTHTRTHTTHTFLWAALRQTKKIRIFLYSIPYQLLYAHTHTHAKRNYPFELLHANTQHPYNIPLYIYMHTASRIHTHTHSLSRHQYYKQIPNRGNEREQCVKVINAIARAFTIFVTAAINTRTHTHTYDIHIRVYCHVPNTSINP